MLIEVYTRLGREQDAKAEAAEAVRLAPKLSLDVVKRIAQGDTNTPDWRQFFDDLRKAGLK